MKTFTVKQVESPILRQDPNQKILELHKENELIRNDLNSLKKYISLLETKNHEMLKNEIQYRNIIKAYQIELKKKLISGQVFNDPNEKYQTSISEIHKEIADNVSSIEGKIVDIVTSREETILAVFNSKLKDITKNLEREKKEKFEYLEGLAEREHMLSKELQMLRGSVGVIEAKNSHLEKENKEIKHLLKIKELEINELRKRMFEIKEKSVKFPNIKSPSMTDIQTRSDKSIKTKSFGCETDFPEDDNSARYQKIISKLQKLLAIEKNNVRAARNAYFREISSKAEPTV
ncbi:hypothetical protein SteCoe_14883 [Stentor coeruleus]|uniref:Uncharacterized protein n=1 Tax=Stentor coeruleus TaxID=5963 RepID=A0A1R2C4W9_9CILI|nr:hypothetical protein SteCoe_14883 [Stentor coeruleus]